MIALSVIYLLHNNAYPLRDVTQGVCVWAAGEGVFKNHFDGCTLILKMYYILLYMYKMMGHNESIKLHFVPIVVFLSPCCSSVGFEWTTCLVAFSYLAF